MTGSVIYIFDLDGTLIDTKEAVRLAYLAAGVEMPLNSWGKPAKDWLIDPDGKIHAAKSRSYPTILRQYAKALPLLETVKRLRIPIITGASVDAVLSIKEIFGQELNIVATGLTRMDKIHYLNHAPKPHGVYVDDDSIVRQYVHTYTFWRALDPKDVSGLL